MRIKKRGPKELHISGCQNITDTSIIKLAECCPNLEFLDIACSYHITDISILKIAESCHGLKHSWTNSRTKELEKRVHFFLLL
jgi:hypothetical protein